MAANKVEHLAFANVDTRYPVTAELVSVNEDKALIALGGHLDNLLEAISVIDLQGIAQLPAKVLVVFEQGELEKPIVTGVIQTSLEASQQPAGSQPTAEDQSLRSKRKLTVGGKTLYIGAEQDIVLECGKSSIRMTRQGKIILKGTDIVSRALRNNKIKGSSINLN